MKKEATVLITGGAGFIGSHVCRFLLKNYPSLRLVNLDKLTYAGNLENLSDIDSHSNYNFVKGDICDSELLEELFEQYNFDGVIHLAAESHVDRSIHDPMAFVQTNIIGTISLLNVCRKIWKGREEETLFYHISTDEVYGSLGHSGYFTEQTPYDPRSPYSSSKASSDHFVRAYGHTYGLRIIISNCSNNYGPNQFPEKLIPLMVNNIREKRELPVYGDGKNIRDWLYVTDHAEAIALIFLRGKPGETYNIGGDNEITNIDMVHTLCDICDEQLDHKPGSSRQLITYVKDRPGHDRRYAIDHSKIRHELGWKPKTTIEAGLSKTVQWYFSNKEWLNRITTGEYQRYYQKQYEKV